MKKIIAVVLVLAVIWAIPSLRTRVVTASLPVLERLGPAADFVSNPVRRYSANNKVTHTGRVILSDVDMGREPPEARGFNDWMRERMPGETGLDPWGNEYWMQRVRNTARVGSSGPDGVADTADDIVSEVTL